MGYWIKASFRPAAEQRTRMTTRLSASDHVTDDFSFGIAGSKPGQNRFAPRIMKFAKQNHNQINQNANPQAAQSQKPDNSCACLAVIKAVSTKRSPKKPAKK